MKLLIHSKTFVSTILLLPHLDHGCEIFKYFRLLLWAVDKRWKSVRVHEFRLLSRGDGLLVFYHQIVVCKYLTRVLFFDASSSLLFAVAIVEKESETMHLLCRANWVSNWDTSLWTNWSCWLSFEKQKSGLCVNTQRITQLCVNLNEFIDDLVGGWLLKIPDVDQCVPEQRTNIISDWQVVHQSEGVRQFFLALNIFQHSNSEVTKIDVEAAWTSDCPSRNINRSLSDGLYIKWVCDRKR